MLLLGIVLAKMAFHHFILVIALLYLFPIMASCRPNESVDFVSVVLLSAVFAINQVEQDRHVSKQSQDASDRREVKPQKQVQR